MSSGKDGTDLGHCFGGGRGRSAPAGNPVIRRSDNRDGDVFHGHWHAGCIGKRNDGAACFDATARDYSFVQGTWSVVLV